uniref:Tegument protein UL16 n=1 Tax=Human betaherpesvirus 6A TaxID=32603 RepID=A0A219XZ78_9BETA|nr:tegument protein UL16 [Human betaherpesvirus 6A]
MAISTFSIGDLGYLRNFLQNECNWFRICKKTFYREYRSVATSSPTFSLNNKPKKFCLHCEIVILKRSGEFMFSLAVNGIHFGQFLTGRMKFNKKAVPEGLYYYILELGSITAIDLNFIPRYNSDCVTSMLCVTPELIYENCSIVCPEEAIRLTVKGSGDNKLTPLGGCGAWCLKNGGDLYIYTFALSFDLFLTCYDKSIFPSLAKIIFDMIACESEDCVFCKDHNKHVSQAGQIVGCVSNQETCFCYTPCKKKMANINNPELISLLCDQEINKIDIMYPERKASLSLDINSYAHGYSGDDPYALKCVNWIPVRISAALSRLIILSCPVCKRVVMD